MTDLLRINSYLFKLCPQAPFVPASRLPSTSVTPSGLPSRSASADTPAGANIGLSDAGFGTGMGVGGKRLVHRKFDCACINGWLWFFPTWP